MTSKPFIVMHIVNMSCKVAFLSVLFVTLWTREREQVSLDIIAVSCFEVSLKLSNMLSRIFTILLKTLNLAHFTLSMSFQIRELKQNILKVY